MMGSEQKFYDRSRPGPCALWPMDLKLTHLDWSPEATLIHFQGQYLAICELDYIILHGEIQNSPKFQAAVDIGEFCLVEDLTSARWYRGRVQNQKKDLYDVFLIDYGNILTVDQAHISSCSKDIFVLPPKIVCGFLSSVLLLPGCCHTVVDQYFDKLIGRNFTGYIQALLPHKVLLLEAPDINRDLVRHGFGRHVDTDTFLLLVEMLTEAPLKQNIEPAPDLLTEKQRGQEFFLKPTSLQAYEDILPSCRPKLKCGSHATVRVTAAINPGLFYCQMADKESELTELSSKLAAVCELKAKVNQMRTRDNLDLLCSVKGKDEKWYRGLVQHLAVNSFVHVLFVDYGYSESVEVENIHKLPPDFYSIPIMSFPCALTCMDNEEDDAKSKQLGFLKTSLLGGILEIEINKYKPEHHLYYITILEAKERMTPTPVQKSPTNANLARSKSDKEQSLLQSGPLPYETIMSKEFDRTIRDEGIQVGSVFTGYVEHVQNPNNFWVRSEKRNEEFEEIMDKLSRRFSRIALEEDILENPEPGMLCCAVYEGDMHYYRGVVVGLLEHGAEVLFIDFGNVGKVPCNLIKKMPEEFPRKSAFALCCSLVNVVPTDEFWTSSSTDSFRCLLSNKILQINVIQMRKNKFDVDLYYKDSGNDGGQSLSELLISTNQAHYGKKVSKQFIGQRKKHNYSKQQVTKHNIQPLLNSKASENCNVQVPEDESDRPKEPVCFKALNIKPGCEFAVCCPLIYTPSDFWCQRLDKLPALEALMASLQEYYSTKTVPLQPETLCCVVKSPCNEKWCRGLIMGRQNGQAKVILADFGSNIQVSEEYLQGLLPEYCVLEGQAFRCSLYNVIEPLALGWTGSSTEFLKTFVADSGRNLKCNVVSQLNVKNKGLCNVVHLCNTESNQSVSDLLVEKSLARVVTRTLPPTVCLESFVYSSYDLSEGSEEQVFVTHVNSHFEVFCQLEKNTAVTEELEARISEVQKVAQANAENVVEKLCLAKYFDGVWYRGMAYSAQLPSHVCVTFVDYGNTIIAEKKHIVFIPKDSTELLNKPMQAMRFSLAGVPRGLICADVKDWLETAVLHKLVKAVIVAKVEDGSFEVELFDGEVGVNDALKEFIHSLTPKPKIAVTFNISGKKMKQSAKAKGWFKSKPSPTTSTQYKKYQNKSNRGYQNKPKVKSPQSKKPEVTKTAKTNDWPRPPKPQTSSATRDNNRHPVVLKISCLPARELTEGSKFICFATHIYSLRSFFLQRSNDEETVLQMLEALNLSVFRETLEACTNIPLKVNDLVLAEYEEDGALYRAVVKEKVDSCAFNVEFVDFGNAVIVRKENMFLMPKDNISQPRFSIPCSLINCSAFNNSAAFTDAVMDKPLMVEFVRYRRSQWEVKLEILDATTSVPVEPAATKESDTVEPAAPVEIHTAPKEASTVLEAKTSTESRLNSRTHATTTKSTVELLELHVSSTVEHTQLDSVQDDERVPDRNPPQKLAFAPVELNKEYSGFAAAITTPFEFFVILEDLHLMSQVSILLDDLQDELQPLPQAHLAPRTGCLVKSELRNKWCRAEILHADTTLTLNLVDYGHAESLSYGDHFKLKTLPDCIRELPKVTYPCILNTVRPLGAHEQWTDEAVIFFQQCLDQRNLQIFFREEVSDCQWKVDVLVNEVHVAKQLVDAGHAIYTDLMLGLRVQEQSVCSSLRLLPEEERDDDPEEGSWTFEELEIFKVEPDSKLCMTM